MVKRSRTTIATGATTGVILLAAFVWPTIYRYDHMNYGGNLLPVRVHRVTGKTEILYPSGWQVAEELESEAVALEDVPPDQLAKLQGNAGVHSSKLSCKMYNGSKWRIRAIVVHLKVLDSDSTSVALERDYRLANEYFTDPLETGIFDDYVWFDLKEGQQIAWHVKSAKGVPQ